MSIDLVALLAPENWSRKHGGPLYAQLSQHIGSAIRNGELMQGDPLPSERELAQISRLSRVTVRKAVQELVRDGLVVQKQGSGTSVAAIPEKVEQSLSLLTSFSEDMQRRGLIANSKWLERGVFSPSPEETMVLGLAPSSKVARISRLRIAGDMPLAIEHASLDTQLLPDPGEVGDSLYAHLEELGCKPIRAMQRISAHSLEQQDAEMLEVAPGAAALRIERISYLKGGKIAEFTRSIYRGDAYDFVAELRLSPGLGN